MKFSGISLLARRRKWVKKQQNMPPPPGAAPAAPTQGGMEGEGKSGNMSPPLGGGHSRLTRLSPRPAYGMCVGL